MQAVRILAVDDQEFNLDLIELAFMESQHVEVIKAINGQEALNILEKDSNFHVILLDLAMPVLDGFETLARLKAHAVWKQIPTIIVTANKEEKTVVMKPSLQTVLKMLFFPLCPTSYEPLSTLSMDFHKSF